MKRLIGSIIALLLAFTLTGTAAAQTYSFSLDQEVVHVYWNADGTAALDYALTFSNSSSADPLDFVDLGLPNGNYDMGSISADVDGQIVNVSSDYQGDGSYGVAVELGSRAIQPGQTGTVHVYVGMIRNVLYKDDDDQNYASAVFSPTWFGESYVYGSTDLTVVYHLPPGVKPEEPRYHPPSSNWPGAQEPERALDSDGRVMYTWWSASANGYTQYKFGASFPRSYVPEDAIVQVDFFGTIIAAIAGLFSMASGALPFCCIAGFFIGLPAWGAINERKRKLAYMPPKIAIEGHGIKRGLTAVEAAVLMETPLDKVMTMILFGVIKKGAAEVFSREPLKLQVDEPLPEGLNPYEKDFLEAFKADSLAKQRSALQDMTVKLIRSVSDKMRGFSRKETTDYYKSINERAWQQIEAAGTPEVKSQMYEESLEWTMLDKNYDDRARRTFTGPVYVPMWWGRYDPGYRGATSAPSTGGIPAMTSTQGRGASGTIPGSAFAASVVTGVQNFSSKVIGDVSGFTSKVTNVTNPPPPPSRSSGGGSRSGGGCACACACAGCACACAGGGR